MDSDKTYEGVDSVATSPEVPDLYFDGQFIDVLWDNYDNAIAWFEKYFGWKVLRRDAWTVDPDCSEGFMTQMDHGTWLVTYRTEKRLAHHFAERGTVGGQDPDSSAEPEGPQRAAGPGHVRVAVDPKAPRVIACFAGVIDADAGADGDGFHSHAVRDAQRRREQVPSVVLPGDAQGLTQLAGAVGQMVGPAPALDHLLDAARRFQRPHQDRLRRALLSGHDVETVVTVDHIHVRSTGRAEHDLGARRPASAVGVGRPVVGADVRLHFYDVTAYSVQRQFLAEQPQRQV